MTNDANDDNVGNPHLIDGDFQSDKYPTCPRGKVPLSTKDPMAQDLLAEYARRRRAVDADFSRALEAALRGHGYEPKERSDPATVATRLRVCIERACEAIDTLELGRRDAVLRLRAALASAQAESAVTVEREKGLRDDAVVRADAALVRALLAAVEREKGLRAALEPFASIADWYDDRDDEHHEIWVDAHEKATRVTVGMCKAAKAALASGQQGEKP